MTYVVSDIHGDLKKLKKLLKVISFDNKKDTLIIAGDILDRGEDDLNAYKFLEPYIKDKSVQIILGNHEFFCWQYLNGKITEKTWIGFGAESNTVNTINNMSIFDRTRFSLYIESMPYCIELEVNDKRYLITHAGLHADYLIYNEDGTINTVASILEGMEKDKRGTLISLDLHYMPASTKKLFDRTLIVGHYPVFNISGNDKIIKNPTYICIDGGVGKGMDGNLACLCLDNGEETYIDK